jgi:hypothetical protein
MMSRALASVDPRQAPSSSIFASIDAEADFTGVDFFMDGSESRT